MVNNNKYVFLPSFSLEPNKVVSYNSVYIRDNENNRLRHISDFRKGRSSNFTNINDNNTVTKKYHNYKISDNAYRNLKRKINWLYYLSKPRKVTTYSGKDIFSFRVGFITLTLPSKQLTPTSIVTKELLNPFLTEIRQRTDMENYVWRLEFQKNGNVHYHLVTDTYLDYFLIRRVWNRLLKSKGYIAPYQKKMNALSLKGYNSLYNKNNKIDFNIMAKRYARGMREKWENPNSVDVRSVISSQSIAGYLGKYFAKKATGEVIKNVLDNEENSRSLRLWFCSRSVSKLNKISNFCDAVEYDIFSIVSYCRDKKEVIGQYAISTYFEIKKFPPRAKKWIDDILKGYAHSQGYLSSA